MLDFVFLHNPFVCRRFKGLSCQVTTDEDGEPKQQLEAFTLKKKSLTTRVDEERSTVFVYVILPS